MVDFIFVRSDGAQPHLVNIQFQKKVQLQVSTMSSCCFSYIFV